MTTTPAADWTFDGFGPHFDDHARGHLPHYDLAHQVIAHSTHFALPPDGTIADLGASTGNAIAAISTWTNHRPFTAWLYDLDQSMLDHASNTLHEHHPHITLNTLRRDLTRDPLDHEQADVTLILWTLQFLHPTTWTGILTQARQHATHDGLILIAAKTRLADARWQEQADAATHDWKTTHGVTEDEAAAKARSLRGTMHVAPLATYYHHLHHAGWNNTAVLFRWYSWVIIGAWNHPLAEH
jgi:tRNA (cmo5U34)-methyltransferase